MSVVVAEGVVEVTADGTSVPRDVARDIDGNGAAVQTAGVGMGKRIFGGVLAGWAAIGGINAITGFFKGAVTGASDLNETMNASTQIFGVSAATIDTWGTTAYKSVGLSKQAAVDAAVGFGNMFTQLGWTSDAAAELSTKTVQVAADLGSFRNLPTADVADRISAALRGEYDSLQTLIPNINAARVEQEALAASGKTNASELTAQEKAAATLAIVQRDGATAMGDFARTSDDAANSAKIVSARFADQQTALGQQLLPVWTAFLSFLSTTAIPVFSSIVTWVGENSQTLLILGGVIGGIALALNIATVAGTIHAAYQAAAAASTGGLTIAQWALNAAMSANPIGIIIVLIGVLIGVIVWVATQTTFFQDTWTVMTDIVGTAATWLWENVLSPVFASVGLAFTSMGTAITWVWENVVSPVFSFITDTVTLIGTTVSDVFGGIASFIGNAFNSALSVVRGPLNGLISLVNGAINGLNSLSVTIPSWVPLVGGQTWGLDIPRIPLLARGSSSAPGMYIAGEAGPELIVGAGGSRVYSNNETRDMLRGGGDTITIGTISIPADTVEDFVRIIELLKALPQVARAGRGKAA